MELHASPLVADSAGSAGRLEFDRVHEQYRSRIHRYLARLVGALDAEDLTQLVFVRVSQALPDFRGESALSTWIYRIARNAAADWRRSVSRTQAIHQELAGGMSDAGGAELREQPPSADEALIRGEMQQCIRGVIDELPDSYRDVLALRELDGLPNAAIADVLGLSLATVKVRLHRARGQLRATLAARCELSRDGRHGLGCERKGSA